MVVVASALLPRSASGARRGRDPVGLVSSAAGAGAGDELTLAGEWLGGVGGPIAVLVTVTWRSLWSRYAAPGVLIAVWILLLALAPARAPTRVVGR